jgi:hypothetical protein
MVKAAKVAFIGNVLVGGDIVAVMALGDVGAVQAVNDTRLWLPAWWAISSASTLFSAPHVEVKFCRPSGRSQASWFSDKFRNIRPLAVSQDENYAPRLAPLIDIEGGNEYGQQYLRAWND